MGGLAAHARLKSDSDLDKILGDRKNTNRIKLSILSDPFLLETGDQNKYRVFVLYEKF